MAWSPFTSHKGQVVASKQAREQRKAARREQREAAKAERAANGEKGAPIAWEQFPSAFPNTHPDVAGIGRTLSRGLR